MIKNTIEMGVLSSVQSKASKNTATLVLIERKNKTTGKVWNFEPVLLYKKISDKILI